MVVEWFVPLSEWHGFFNLFNYLTFRTGGALVLAFLLSVWSGEFLIQRLRIVQSQGQPIRDLDLDKQMDKQGTPTMGGFIIWFGLFAAVLIWADLRNPYIWVVLFLTVCYAAIGFADDYTKVSRVSADGVSAHARLICEFLVAGIACAFILGLHGAHTPAGHAEWGALNPLAHSIATLAPQTAAEPNQAVFAGGVTLPFVSDILIDLGPFFIPFGMIIVVGWANAVNFTDGLDGLAIVPSMFAAAAYALIAYLTGNFVFAKYLGLQFIPGAGELAVLMGAMLGAAMGFLWYNTHPAQVFMGDTGSLGLGGLLGVVAVAVKHEFALVIIGGLFVLEILSVVTQVGWFKLTRRTTGQGRRIFKMAPLHHHFQKVGWPETRIVVRFWILSALFALAGLATLKLR